MCDQCCDSSKNFISIFKHLIDYKSFLDILNKMPTQTPMMAKKQVITVSYTHSNTIVKIENMNSLDISEWFPEE